MYKRQTSRNNLNNSINPTAGNKFTFGTEQFVSMGKNSPTFNRMRASYSYFIPTKLINLTKACKSSKATSEDCPQAIGFQFKAGTILANYLLMSHFVWEEHHQLEGGDHVI